MKNLYFYALIIMSFFYFSGCQDNNNAKLNFEFPLTVGAQWTYQRIQQSTNFSSDSLKNIYSTNDTSETTVKVSSIVTLRDSVKTVVLKNGRYAVYYQARDDGLYEIAYQNAGAGLPVLPKQSEPVQIKLNNRTFKNVAELSRALQSPLSVLKIKSDSLLFDDPPAKTLQYPFQLEAQWTYRKKYDPFLIDKRVMDVKTLRIESGSFLCYHIKWLYDFDNDGVTDDNVYLDDYISKEGLIERDITVLNIKITNTEGQELGTHDYFDHYKLIDFSL